MSQTAARLTIMVAANFTAEPVGDVLLHWMRTLDIDATLAFAPYNQVMQQLLDAQSELSMNAGGVNVVLLRHDVFAGAAAPSPEAPSREWNDYGRRAIAAADACARAVATRAQTSGSAWIVICCPSLPTGDSGGRADLCAALEDRTAAALAGTQAVRVIRSSDVLGAYGITDYYDPYGHRLGDAPYTPAFFAALATTLARNVHAMVTPPRKVVAVDCDNTLWSGICGEDGTTGVVIDAPREYLQRFLIEQMNAGMLVCLCSRNNERDVWSVFDEHPAMILRREHIAAWRINWDSKAGNVRSLADELELGLDTFIFVDDDPVVCGEVRQALPQVLTVQLPNEPHRVAAVLDHSWAFDRWRVTDEDRDRTRQYALRRARMAAAEDVGSIEEYVRTLDVRVRIEPAGEPDYARIAQLTHRTTQFNCTLQRYSEAMLRQLGRRPSRVTLAVHVSDRFGDYGLVGAVMGRHENDRLEIDTFILSCRALGRDVEHHMMRAIEEAARRRGCAAVFLPFVPGERNSVAKRFLDGCTPVWIRRDAETQVPGAQEYVLMLAEPGSAAGKW